ncbi:hypothetical protein ANSO36C_33950 [Nostoc cf. commune SO-36]|uniref:Uncharacterized protein n=1 Tax=Nostoc cf. commune SO-36 TaxID=449208 RepID=A0ABM7Z3L9_NOSCO|nr:hypothetical protein [Nostoc commune]BDI17593.1 hypothetical protein ANSO36C_33950 [Nostoc cf. commune SO-36]
MLTTLPDTSANLAIALLINYSFDLSGYTANELVERWQTQYPLNWLHLAVIEALYQGRYKAVSVQQILVFWQRRDQATYHFNMEFERMICSKFPQSLTSSLAPSLSPAKKNPTVEITSPQLPPAKIRNGYQYSNTATLQLNSSEPRTSLSQEEEQEDRDHKTVLKSPLSGKFPSAKTLQLSSAVSQRQTSPESPSPYSSASHHQRQPKLLPPAAIHAPIGQFTPEKSDRTDSFTSKLKAMSGEQNSSWGSGE